MRIALLSDIHGNDVAFRAVLADIRMRGVDQIVCLGDVATLGSSPQRTVELLAGLNCLCIMGNHDAFLFEPELVKAYTRAAHVIDAIDWCREELSRDSLDYLRTFKPLAALPLGLGSMLLYHGSPRSNVEDILATTPPELLDAILEGRQAMVMAGGHTHVQMLRQHRGSLVVNVGSVGMPFKEYVAGARPTILTHAEYAVVEEAGGVVGVTLYRVPVDKNALQDSLAQTTNPLRDWLIQQYA
ncbi:metallophosphoesterase [Bradyrhizobium frederickii]|uniref:Metallophosphoesterase n=1 Tax=Bradyrhizobium frederickii TaxID=2560054 RepID=A0A4Y9LG19_9BRAD|nr:metallophosphoesterase family protein [Bradyrhizobium frederickii]TFV42530.1 metallophosphoesterase [Bradyrhizobium frederickii]